MQDRNILIVEDDIDMRRLIAQYLERAGFDVREVGNAQEMRLALADGPVDLLLLDVMLPGQDGLDICRRLRGDPDHASLPIIMLTALTDMPDRVVGLEIGADDYLGKPFEPRELLARIKAVLRRSPRMAQPAAPAAGVVPAELEVIRFEGWELDTRSRQLISPERVSVGLASLDYRVLLCLLRHPDEPLSRDRLLTEAFGRERSPIDRAVDVCVSRLRAHLEPDSRKPRIIRTVRHEGYMYSPTRDAAAADVL